MPRADAQAIVKAHTAAAMAAKYEPLFSSVAEEDCFPTGVSVLNLAMSGRVHGGGKLGSPLHVVGDSDTCKSLLGLTILAEAALCPRFDNYGLYKDDTESACAFPIARMFGDKLADRLRHPGVNGDSSYYIEDFYHNAFRLLNEGPQMYVLDSMDGMESHAGQELFEENAKRAAAGKELKQSFTDGKAKKNSENLRKLRGVIEKTKSMLAIISQTRANIDPMSMAESTHAGGKALKFNASYQLWMAPRGKLNKSIHGKDHQIGTLVRFKLSKNHVTGRHIDLVVPIYYGYGIDDEQTTIRWMIDPAGGGVWKLGSGKLTTRGEEGLKKEYPLNEFLALTRKNSAKFDAEVRTSFDTALQRAWDELEQQLHQPGRYGGSDAPASIFDE